MAEIARSRGLTMCYHNHYWEFVRYADGRYGWDVLMDEAPALCGQIDLYWASNFGAVDVPALVRRYAARTPLVHVKDGPLKKDEPNTAVGGGAMDIPACVRAADPAVLTWLVVELDRCAEGGDMLEIVRQSARYLQVTGLGAAGAARPERR
jgi:sugar phosphate isomerase/epimerase